MTYTGIGETQRIGNGTTKYQYDWTGLGKQTESLGATYVTSLPDGTLLSETVPSGSAALPGSTGTRWQLVLLPVLNQIGSWRTMPGRSKLDCGRIGGRAAATTARARRISWANHGPPDLVLPYSKDSY